MRFIFNLLLLALAFPNFQIDQTQSTISYTGRHPFHSWQGTTSQIDIITDCDIISLDCDATISIPVMSFISGNDNRDSNMLFCVDAFSYPLVKISFSNINISNLLSSDKKFTTDGEINFHGIKKSQQIPLFITKEEDIISIRSDFSITLDLFGIDRPSLLMLPINNEINIDVLLLGQFTN